MKRVVYLLVAAFLLVSCGSKQQPVVSIDGFALGTIYTVKIKGEAPLNIEQKLDSVFAVADNTMSVFNSESLLNRINRNETDRVDENIAYCIELARGVSELSGGKYDITVQPLVEAYGFMDKEKNAQANVDSILQFVDYRKIDVREGRLVKQDPRIKIGLNSIAKGYTVDLVALMLEREGVDEYLVNIGGEIFSRGTNAAGKAWTVGIETPFEGNYIQGAHTYRMLAVSGQGVATSGNYRNFHTDSSGTKYTHIIDPVTGRNTASNLLSATSVAESCALADALGTMFIALGLEASQKLIAEHPELAVMLIYADEKGGMKVVTSEAMNKYMVN